MPWEYPDDSLVTICRDCHKQTNDESANRMTFFNSWEDSACFEIRRQIGMIHQEIDVDEGCLFYVERAANDIGWPPHEAMHLLKIAAEEGIMTEEWLSNLAKQVASIMKQKLSNQ